MFHVKLSEPERRKKKFWIKSSSLLLLYRIFPIFFHTLLFHRASSLYNTIATPNRGNRENFCSWNSISASELFCYILSLMKFEVKAIYLLWLRRHISLYEPPASTFAHICWTGIPPFFHCFHPNFLSLALLLSLLGESSASAVTSACSQTLGTLYGNLVPLVLYSTLLLMSKMWWWCVLLLR